VLAVASTVAFFALAAAASAATYFVEQGGSGAAPCAEADPCGSISDALDAHRVSPEPDDVIDVGQGLFPENVDATDPADDGLEIRGSLDPGGNPATVVSGEGGDGAPGCFAPCIVALGAPPDTQVAMANVFVVQESTDLDSNLTPIFLEGGSDLTTVDVQVRDENTFAMVELCDDPGSVFDDVILDAVDSAAAGISGCAGVTVLDSSVFTNDAPALDIGASPTSASEVTRSLMSVANNSPLPVLALTSGLTLDSSLLTGGLAGVDYQGTEGAEIIVNNSTLDVRDPGVNDTDDDARSLFIGRQDTEPIAVAVDSSLLVEQLEVDFGSTPTSLTCEYTNITDLSTPLDPDFTNDCPTIGDPGSTNTAVNVGDLFANPFAGDWSLQDESPAIDAGQPGPIPAGLSDTDIDGAPRRQPGTAATCPDGVRDQGAYEAPATACSRTLTVSTVGTGAGTVTGPGIDCGAGHTDCSEAVPSDTEVELTATPAQGSSFAGFSGGGCSASPCTVTLDANKSVQARFTAIPPIGDRTISLMTNKRRVKRGGEVTLSGQISSSNAACVANQTVELQRKRRGGGFRGRVKLPTGAQGRFSHTFRISKPPRKFRVSVAASPDCAAAESAAVEIRKRKRKR
jgi:hypothetical protein